jgi:hypothetical protein
LKAAKVILAGTKAVGMGTKSGTVAVAEKGIPPGETLRHIYINQGDFGIDTTKHIDIEGMSGMGKSTLLVKSLPGAKASPALLWMSSDQVWWSSVGSKAGPEVEWSHGRSISPNQIARILKRFDIYPLTIRIADGTPEGYRRADFEDVWARRYPPP